MKKLIFILSLFLSFPVFGQVAFMSGGYTAEAGYCAEYQAVYDAYTTKPDAATAAIWNTCVETWVANGEWATKDVIYVYAAHTNGAGEALKNWKNPGTFDATAYLAPTHTANQGILGNGTTQYIDCGGWVSSTHGVNYVQNSASQIIYVRTDIAANTWHGVWTSAGTKGTLISPRYGNDKVYFGINDAGQANYANANGSGMYVNTRTAAAVKVVYKNKVLIFTSDHVSTGVPTHSPYCLAYNADGVATAHRADQVSLYAFGAGMTQTHVDNFTDPFEVAMDALGTGIIAMADHLEELILLHYLALKIRIEKYENNIETH